MSAIAGNLAGTGAMLARLVQLGARCGLTAETTLVHVLDGAPLPLQPDPGHGQAAIRDDRAAATAEEPGEIAPETKKLADIGFGLAAPATGEKRERIAELYAGTALRYPAIARIVGSTRGSVSHFVRELRAKADPRIIRGDEVRGIANSGAAAPTKAPMAVDGVGDDCSTELRSQSDDILPAGSNGEGRRADPVPDVSPERAEECAERDAGAQSPGGDVAANPAPPAVQEDEPEKGMVSSQQPTLDAPAAAGTADRPAGPGQELPETADGMVGGFPVAAAPSHAEETGVIPSTRQRAEVERRIDPGATGGESAAEEAGAAPPAEPASSIPYAAAGPTASDEVERLWRDTLLTTGAIGRQVGKSTSFVGAIISQKRKKRRPAILAGDAARIAADAQRLGLATAPASPGCPPAEVRPDDLARLEPGQVLAIDRGWIVGPAGSLKGFTLVNAVLAALSGGAESDARAIARKTAIRSGDAVLAQLAHWKDDLATIGIGVIRSGGSGIQLARA